MNYYFTGNKQIEIKSSDREHYKISIILSVAGNCYKLSPLIIVKGEPGKTVETELRRLFCKKNIIHIYCQKEAWCTTYIFKEWVLKIFKCHEKEIGNKCLLILDKEPSHCSYEAINFLKENNVNFTFIPAGMTPICQPLDIGINNVFKDNIKLLFEKNSLFCDNLNQNIRLKQVRINLIEYIIKVWYSDSIITKTIIVNSFVKAGIINNSYTIKEEDKIMELYAQDLNYLNDFEIIDDLSIELKVNSDDLEKIENNSSDEESEFDEKEEDIMNNNKVFYNVVESIELKNEIYDLSEKFKEDIDNKMDIDFE